MAHDLAVIGAGVIGLGVAYEAAYRGLEVVCLDSAPGAAQSAGPGRIFRVAHTEPKAVRTAMAAKAEWERWEQLAGRPFIAPDGLVVVGEESPAYAAAMQRAGAGFRWYSEDELSSTVPAEVERGHELLLDEAGGTIDAEGLIRWLIDELGERLRRERVNDLRFNADQFEITTATRELEARRVVIAAGTDTPDLASAVGVRIAQATFRHARYELTNGAATRGWTACFLDRRFATRSRWSHYGVPLGPDHLAVGTAWGEAPFPALDFDADQIRQRVLAELLEWAASFGADTLGDVVGIVDCTYPRFRKGLAPFTILRNQATTIVIGEELFKFAPLAARRVCDTLFGDGRR